MNKTKAKKKSRKKEQSKKNDVIDIKEYFLQKIESLSWDMGKKKYSTRNEIYDR